MAITGLKINMFGLMEISNLANEKIAAHIAEKVAKSAKSDNPSGDYVVRSTPRVHTGKGVGGWARTTVTAANRDAVRAEVTRGVLARSLGGG